MTLSSERRYDLDWLRVLGVLLLIPFHVALIFVLDPNAIMYIKDVVNSRVLEVAAGFVHMWHMPMLFVISGSATYFALGFRSAGQYIRERFLRLLVPLVFGILTFVPFTTYIQHSNILSLQEGYIGYFHFDLNHLDGLNGTFTPAHLWFILYLFVFSLIGLPLFQALRSGKGKEVIKALGALTQSPLSLMAWGIPLTLAAALNILGDKNPLYYFLILFYGFVLAGDVGLQQSIDKLTWVVLAYGVFAAVINVMAPIQSYGEWTVQWMALGLMYEMGRWALTLAVLGLGHRFLNRTSNFLRYASEAAMPFYLLHMTFSVLTGYFAIQLDAPVAVKYPLTVLVATGLTLVAYELVRRWKGTRWLFGMKPLIKGMPDGSNAKLDQVKELTHQTMQRIIRFAPFQSVEDFLTRVDLRAQEAENLARVGALEGLGNIPSILRRLQNGGWQQNQLSLFEWVDSNEEDWSLQQKVDAQLEILGASLAAHPLELVADNLSGTDAISTVDAVAKVGRRVTVAGVQQASHRTRTARGDMLFLSFEDLQGTLDAILFPEVYRQAKTSISSTKPFLLTGIMEMDTERGEPFLRVEKVMPVK